MDGQFGVFDGTELLQEFDNDVDAEKYRSELLEENIPEPFRRSSYDAHQLEVREMPEDPEEYTQMSCLLRGLRASLRRDRGKTQHAAT